MNKLITALGTCLGAIGLIGLMIIYDAFAWGYVNYILYNWFILPYIPLPKFTILEFIGFTLFINAFIHPAISSIKSEYKEKSTTTFTTSIITPWFLFICAWFIKIILF